MKKFLSLIFVSVLVLSSFSVWASARGGELNGSEFTEYPVIMVAGYSSSNLWMGDDPDNKEAVWSLQAEDIISMVLGNIVKVGTSLGALTIGNTDLIAKTVGDGMVELCGVLACDSNGDSVNPIHTYASTAEETNAANVMKANPDGDNIRHETDIDGEIAEYIGWENIYDFQCDFRMSQAQIASELNDYIQSVKEYSGKDKVNIVAVSHGGQITSSYLTRYGYKTNDVNNVVMNVPAIGGAGLAIDILSGNITLDEEFLVRFVEHGLMCETDFNWLLKAQQLGLLDEICDKLVPYIHQIVGNWASIWDFLPTKQYEELKAELLDPVTNKGLIEKCDDFHYNILPLVSERLQYMNKNGSNINIIAGSGGKIVTGYEENADGIITVPQSTGATCAPLGQRFADGYTQINYCDGKNKVSPDMTIDASTAYLPDNTWFINGLFHGMQYWDNHTRVLLNKLLLTDEITDVYSDPEYPQFRCTSNPSSSVYFEFNNETPGFLSSESDCLTVTNCCEKNILRVTSVVCDGLDISFKVNPFIILKPGESVDIPFTGDLPETGKKVFYISVNYSSSTLTPLGCRTEGFTLNNGATATEEGLRSVGCNTPFDTLIGDDFSAFLSKLGLKEYFSMIYSVIYYWFSRISSIF